MGANEPATLALGAALVAAGFGLGALVGARGNGVAAKSAESGLGARLGLGAGARRREMDRTVDLLDYFLKNPGPAITLATLVFGMTFAKISELEKLVALNRLEAEKNAALGQQETRFLVAQLSDKVDKLAADVRNLGRPPR